MKPRTTDPIIRTLIPRPRLSSDLNGVTPKGEKMKILIAIIMTAACLFASEPVAVDARETPANDNIVTVGFDRYREFELVSQALNSGTEKDLHYYVVSSDVINRELLPEFLKRVKRLYPYNNFTARELREFWTNLFSAPVHVFVFSDAGEAAVTDADRFSHSEECRCLVCGSLESRGGFMWMGIMSVVEDRIKALLAVPESERLVATVFFGDQSGAKTGQPPEAR
jgi:hypothetical protein